MALGGVAMTVAACDSPKKENIAMPYGAPPERVMPDTGAPLPMVMEDAATPATSPSATAMPDGGTASTKVNIAKPYGAPPSPTPKPRP